MNSFPTLTGAPYHHDLYGHSLDLEVVKSVHHQEAKVSEAWKALRSSIAASKEQLQGKAKCLEEWVHVAFME